MKRLLFGWCVALSVAVSLPAWAADAIPPQFPKTKILVLGAYHMDNPGRDVFNLEADDVLTGKRQAEITAVVEALAKFRPTKIALETNFGTARINKDYRAYLAGAYALTRNEIDQLGFRLARALGHGTVFPVDAEVDDGITLEEWERSKVKYAALHDALAQYGAAYTGGETAKLKSSTVGQYLAFLNSPEQLAANHFFYMAFFMKMAADDDTFGERYVAGWYERNLLIVGNILKIANADGSDRILVIFGQGHAYLLKQFLSESPYFEVADVADFLPKE